MSKLNALRYRIEYLAFAFVGLIFRLMPLEAASSLSGTLWRLFAPFSSRFKRSLKNLEVAYPSHSEAMRYKIALESWGTMGRIFAETFRLVEICNSGRVVVENLDEIRNLIKDERGFIVCAAHQGNWEVGVAALRQIGIETAGIYRPLKNPFVNSVMSRQRETLYLGGLFPKSNQTARTAMRHVRNGGVISIMADLRDKSGIMTPFFGREAPSTPFPALLAVTLGKKLLIGQVIRDSGVRFRVKLEEVDVTRTGNRETNIATTTVLIQSKIEGFVREYPDQWMWSNRRWG